MIRGVRKVGSEKCPCGVRNRADAVWERSSGPAITTSSVPAACFRRIEPGCGDADHGSVSAPRSGAPEQWVDMTARRLAIAFTSAALLAAPVAAQADSRDLPRPSRSEAPARFGTIAYSQWYAKQASAIRYGWGPRQFRALKQLWYRESSWNHKAVNPSSGAWGIPQSLPARKMRTHGKDYRTNPETQIDWGLDYIKERYGSPVKAWAFWKRHHWY
ncbi:MAG: transglycosylase SLT domain-containing protein [Actinobacteria bacterium]|nr:transglycosylase SLT domain-containing protein [Actinomycetota bacterium]MCB8997363.1 transglycosylase SLT domain-containing protein [Actinomycetota bacterium]MCB9414151.1 transglycosylase SLT domain-containing protein [Actinomycetota bacterium]MCB9423670.1 transglycosylase SLT domain-containing protein [Actinomycetota bacterium]